MSAISFFEAHARIPAMNDKSKKHVEDETVFSAHLNTIRFYAALNVGESRTQSGEITE